MIFGALFVVQARPAAASSPATNKAFCAALAKANAIGLSVNNPDDASFATDLKLLRKILVPVERATSMAPRSDPAIRHFARNADASLRFLSSVRPSSKISANSPQAQKDLARFSNLWNDINPVHSEVLAACGQAIANAFDPGLP